EKSIPTILTLLGENVTRPEVAEVVARHYAGVLDQARARSSDTYLSVKPTQLGIDLDLGHTVERYRTLAAQAAEIGKLVAIDMEDSSYVDRTLEIYRRLQEEHSNVAVCLQSYLHRTADDLESLLPLNPKIRLVKGAYKEHPSVAYARKRDVDDSFLRLAKRMLDAVGKNRGTQAYFGTHDPRMVEGVIQLSETLGLDRSSFEFQMLYGIQRNLQTRLADTGYRIRVLISYGDAWFPWFMRRLAERPANVFFVLKNLFAA
ncbi:MAG: proline dehydrogenase family protein, partial [Gemmatimonadota bacterium]